MSTDATHRAPGPSVTTEPHKEQEMATKKAEKVENVEYEDKSYEERSAQAGDEVARVNDAADVAQAEGFEVGKPAPKTLYQDEDGNVTESPVGRGRVLVFEGDNVTSTIVRAVADSKK